MAPVLARLEANKGEIENEVQAGKSDMGEAYQREHGVRGDASGGSRTDF